MRPLALVLAPLALLLAPIAAQAAGSSAKATPTPAPTASATPVASAAPDEELPTVGDDDNAAPGGGAATPVPVATPGDEWAAARGRDMILGMRAGFHSFDLASGGLALEFAGVTPWKGPWWLGACVGYHTGYAPAGADKQSRFFDEEYGGIEVQHRQNLGRLNTFYGGGLGLVSANSAEVTLPDGSPSPVSSFGPQVYGLGGIHLPMGGKMGLVGLAKYAVAPVPFSKTKQTLVMGGLTIAAGLDFGF